VYETFEHTADLGLRVVAPTLEALFEDAATGLFTVIAGTLEGVRAERTVRIELTESDLSYLLADWLRELLYRFGTERVLFGHFMVRLHEGGLVGEAAGEPVDLTGRPLEHEVKAITYHRLELARVPEGWRAELIVDI
jgi:SHS2 domain-containing protein